MSLRVPMSYRRGFRQAAGSSGGGSFSQENSLPGGSWLTTFEAGWGPARTLPQEIEKNGGTLEDDGYGIYDWSSDWYNNLTDRYSLTASVSPGATTLLITRPADTTVVGSYTAGQTDMTWASRAGWRQSHKLYIQGHANPYFIAFEDYPSGMIRLNRGLDAPVSNGATVSFDNGFTVGQTVLVLGQATGKPYEAKVIQSIPNQGTLVLTSGLTQGRSVGAGVSPDFRGLSTIVSDGGSTALRQRLPREFRGGYFPGKIGKHPNNALAVGRMSWPTGLCTGYFYVGAEIKLTRDDGGSPDDFSHAGNVGTKWAYVKSDASGNGSLAHILSAFGGWDGSSTLPTEFQMYPIFTTQTNYGSPAYGPSSTGSQYQFPNDAVYHNLEILCTPNTGNLANGTLKVWLDGSLIVDKTACIFFFRDNGMTPDYNIFEPQAVFGGGLSPVPWDQSMWTRRCIVKVR